MEKIPFNVGDSVHYVPDHTTDPSQYENGVVKALGLSMEVRFVVYNCNGEWHRIKDYTGAATNIRNLRAGWHPQARNKTV